MSNQGPGLDDGRQEEEGGHSQPADGLPREEGPAFGNNVSKHSQALTRARENRVARTGSIGNGTKLLEIVSPGRQLRQARGPPDVVPALEFCYISG